MRPNNDKIGTQAICLALAMVLICPFASAQWVRTSLDVVSVTCLAINGKNLFAGTQGGVFLSTNNGTSWAAVNTGLTDTDVRSFAVCGTDLFAGTWGVFLSTNNGTSWTAVNQGLPKISWDSTLAVPINCFAVRGTNLFAGANTGGIFLSTNSGTSWTEVDSGLPKVTVYSLAASGTNLFAGIYGGVFLSTNNGTSWAPADAPFSDFSSMVHLGPNLFAGTSGGLFLSTNNGALWAPVDSCLVDVSALAVSGTNLFGGTSVCGSRSCHDSLFLSTNNGTNWTAVGSGLSNGAWIHALVVSDSHLFAGLSTGPPLGGVGGVWRRSLSEMIASVSLPTAELATQFSLSQNYPNPFNPSTVIRYQLPVASNVKLAVYDILGREVSVLVNERRPPGVHEVKFDASNLASGAYFYRIRAGDFVSTKKLLIVK